MRRGMNVSWESYGFYTTDLISAEAVKHIKGHDSKSPMFLYVAHLAVHSANQYQYLQAPDEVIRKFSYIKDKNRRTFAGKNNGYSNLIINRKSYGNHSYFSLLKTYHWTEYRKFLVSISSF